MTEKEWQERYEITSTKGRIWKRSELRKRAGEMLKSLRPDTTPVARRTAVLAVLDDAAFIPRLGAFESARVLAWPCHGRQDRASGPDRRERDG